ncbi:hypothetical protein [Dorea sp. D27]|uniref:hypothetical protein n=1 Tax=Dorea sp. D27 TaxID=658665 RepID=UPI0006739289|nr:hypothetical protein [Dorea sp. D27]
MADFFEDLGKRISDVANDIGKKTEDTLEIQKRRSEIRTLRRASDRDLMDIGKMIYDKFRKGELNETDCIALCEEIEKRDMQIEKQEEEIARIRGEG